jgi:hypothetical protein
LRLAFALKSMIPAASGWTSDSMAWGIRIGRGDTTTSSSRPSVSGPGRELGVEAVPQQLRAVPSRPGRCAATGCRGRARGAVVRDGVVEPHLGVDDRLGEPEQLLQLVDRRGRRTRRRSRP